MHLPPGSPSRRPPPARAGLTFVELMVVLTIMLVAVSMFTSLVVATSRQRSVMREHAIAADAARSALERLRNQRFEQLVALFDADPFDDPDGAGSAPGPGFAVAGLDAVPGDPDGLPGELVLPLVDVAFGGPPIWELREDFVEPDLGLPRDLNGDNVVDARDHSRDYFVLPVIARVRWQGGAGEQELDAYTMLVEYLHVEP